MIFPIKMDFDDKNKMIWTLNIDLDGFYYKYFDIKDLTPITYSDFLHQYSKFNYYESFFDNDWIYSIDE